ncbi:MAG: efflux RND transporter permease subunit [Planctomycetota bacterium]|nr:efflux RND transporter permease subunit [Planctomycetota bacterium]
MRFADVFINNPVKVTSGVILLVLFGLLTIVPPEIFPSPIRVPVQLTPNIDEPVVSVSTFWEGASPEEVEREIIDPQEDMLKSLSNLRKMTSTSDHSSGNIILEFAVGTNQDVAKQDVSDALRRVRYQIPLNEFDNPIVQSGRPYGEEAIAWMILFGDEEARVPELHDFVEDRVKPELERVEGISSVGNFGGREREIQIVVDPLKLAQAGITFGELERAVRSQNTNVSAGTSSQGKREIVIRTMGQFESLDDIRETVLTFDSGVPIRVRDVAQVIDTFKKRYGFVRSRGSEVIALPAYREAGSNVIKVMEDLRKAIATVNEEILAPRNLTLELTQVYDETRYIESAVGLVRSNILLGGAMAIAVLMLFLRSLSGTVVVALAIPISVIGTFLVIPLAGRNVNVVMLAGLAFAVGMVVDNAIVVLENIYRHRSMGKSRREAAADGAGEVWGAVLANSLTTMVVFLPILFVPEEAGQLFRDIAIAISGAVGLSLIVSVTVIPALASRILARSNRSEGKISAVSSAVAGVVRRLNRGVATRLLVVVGFTVASVLFSIWLSPKPTYLPSGNQNLIFGFLLTPPGYNTLEFERIAKRLESGNPATGEVGIRRFWEVEPDSPEHLALLDDWFSMVERKIIPDLEKQIEVARTEADDPTADRARRRKAERRERELKRQIAESRVAPPPIDNFFFVAFSGNCFMGCSSKVPELVKPLELVLSSTQFAIPDSFTVFFQQPIFSGGSGNSVDIEIRGDDLDQVIDSAREIMMACSSEFGGRPEPSPRNFAIDRREDRLVPDRVRAGELGMSVVELGAIVRACGDGRIIGQYYDAGKSVDLAIKTAGTEDPSRGRSSTDMIANVPIFTPMGGIVPLSTACRIERATAPQQISHIETQRAVKLTVRAPEGMALPQVIDVVQNDIIGAMRADGYGKQGTKISSDVVVSLAGNADKLKTTWDSFKWLLALSLLIVYLVMAGLFESFAYPFVIILTVPFAVVGGFIGLRLVNEWTWRDPTMDIQQLDMLTILGFVILLGVVVNNGILIVHQTLNFIRYGYSPADAIAESVRTRLRPIFMTVMTTFFGQLLLVVRPGAGAELYRGLGSVVLGGLVVSTVLTLFVVPAMLSLFVDAKSRLGRWVFGDKHVESTGAVAGPGGPGSADRVAGADVMTAGVMRLGSGTDVDDRVIPVQRSAQPER